MGDLASRLSEEMKQALRAGEKVRLAALRMLLATATNRQKELRRDLTEEEFVEVVRREVKRRREAAEAFAKGGREEMADREREEQRVLEAYLPAGLSEQEIDALIAEAVEATGASGPGDAGKVIGQVMAKAKGRVEGGEVSRRVRERLAG